MKKPTSLGNAYTLVREAGTFGREAQPISVTPEQGQSKPGRTYSGIDVDKIEAYNEGGEIFIKLPGQQPVQLTTSEVKVLLYDLQSLLHSAK